MASTSDRGHVVRKMADLLRVGAVMLGERCPQCGLPLFRLRSGEVVCPVHGRVIIVRDEVEYARATAQATLEALERALVSKLGEAVEAVRRSDVTDTETARSVIAWLEALERVERLLDQTRASLHHGREERRRG